jgi:hypothetical protein
MSRTIGSTLASEMYPCEPPLGDATDIVIAYQETGQTQEAMRAAEQLLAERPNSTIAAWLKKLDPTDTPILAVLSC